MTFQEDVKEAQFLQLAGQTHLFFRVNQWQKSSKLLRNGRLDLYIRGAENGKFGLALSTLGDFENGYDLIRFSEKSVIINDKSMILFYINNIFRLTLPELRLRTRCRLVWSKIIQQM
jgi:hypothetical protein